MKVKLLYVSILLLLLAAGCDKDKYNKPIGNRREMVAGSTWRVGEIKDNGTVTSLGCKHDDLWVFSPDGGNGYIDDGNDRCNTEDNTTFSYEVTGDQRSVHMWNMDNKTDYGAHFHETWWLSFEFIYMTESEMIVRYYDDQGLDGRQHHYEIRFVRAN